MLAEKRKELVKALENRDFGTVKEVMKGIPFKYANAKDVLLGRALYDLGEERYNVMVELMKDLPYKNKGVMRPWLVVGIIEEAVKNKEVVYYKDISLGVGLSLGLQGYVFTLVHREGLTRFLNNLVVSQKRADLAMQLLAAVEENKSLKFVYPSGNAMLIDVKPVKKRIGKRGYWRTIEVMDKRLEGWFRLWQLAANLSLGMERKDPVWTPVINRVLEKVKVADPWEDGELTPKKYKEYSELVIK